VVTSRSEALLLQDKATQYSTVSTRAPELFDVASDAVLDTRTDVWSLGTLLYTLAYGYSPFECEFHNGDQPKVSCTLTFVICIVSHMTAIPTASVLHTNR
jgi:serine/threonine kinase 16